MDKITEYLDLVKELEKYAKLQYNISKGESTFIGLMKRKEFKNIKSNIDYCREVRNLLVHSTKINDSFLVSPSNEMINLLRGVIEKVKNPLKAKDIMIKVKDICYCEEVDFVLPKLKIMTENVFSNIPILEDKTVVGVFSESTLLNYLLDEEIIEIDKTLRFHDIQKYTKLENHRSESFIFVPANMLKADIEEKFENSIINGEKIGLAFVTQNGKADEKIWGIISVWDLKD